MIPSSNATRITLNPVGPNADHRSELSLERHDSVVVIVATDAAGREQKYMASATVFAGLLGDSPPRGWGE